MKKTIAYVTGTRADYGLMRPTLEAINSEPNLAVTVVATGMHLMDEFGCTLGDVKRDRFDTHIIEATYEKDRGQSMAAFVGTALCTMSSYFDENRPDCILLLGDRGEMLAGAIAGAYMGIPVAHIHGGDVSSTVDDATRHAITKFAHIHFAATAKSADRLIQMGEEAWRVHTVGSPSIDSVLNQNSTTSSELTGKYGLDASKPIILACQHPVTVEQDVNKENIRETLEALASLGHQTIVIYPNADAGGREMIDVIKTYEHIAHIKTFKSIPHEEYLGLMSIASVMVGNSSSGIVEAPSFGLPVVNIGTRQLGRERAGNVIDVGYDRKEIGAAIEKAITDTAFRARVKKCSNPYGDGKASQRIVALLRELETTPKLLQKKLTY